MKEKLYTMLKIKGEYGLTMFESILWLFVRNSCREEYIHYPIELRDGGHIVEKNKEQPIDKRTHYLTRQGYQYLEKMKTKYLKHLIKRLFVFLGCALAVALLNEFVHQFFE